ncbi:SDR family NAD(P)-dependent oxidoreductase [Luteipulveratus flavus]|uniref:SDR family NAD(P)-dependent oxidoreductase n=1 Tax=Luteipulveratus flavus TaxID=3031728 RepID=A0ABT6C974_9MICO|nr:SDR family NAD(P)-dependent oxidoreductase [Luteipulveratus sp. YIM 133296]MDF8264852.1 SDR family NAD(P)-dependent oxidoreductase [Luteipulveratus sp. YIM 133296]
MTEAQHTARPVALVTGASSGIGLATALRLAARGTTVVLVGRSEETLAQARRACELVGGTAVVAVADVRDTDALHAAFETAASLGRLETVVHCAGVLAYGRFEDVPPEVFEAVLDTTLVGATRVCREAVRRFRAAEGGSVVLVGSLLGKATAPGMISYTTAKWGMHGFVRTLQQENRDRPDVRISLISPGGVDTPIYQLAGTYLGRHGQAPPPVAGADRVAEAILKALDRPRRDLDVGVANKVIVLGFRTMPGLYDLLVGPLLSRLALQPGSGVPAGSGNVLQPRPADEIRAGRSLLLGTDDRNSEGDVMSSNGTSEGWRLHRTVAAPTDRVWEVLADGWSYATWVVGTARIRAVDQAWPAPGSRIHHSAGVWPVLLSDTTVVEACEPGRRLVLTARGWPAGEARVRLTLEPDGEHACTVTIQEDVVSGPSRVLPKVLRQSGIAPRNTETLRRLALLAERRADADE